MLSSTLLTMKNGEIPGMFGRVISMDARCCGLPFEVTNSPTRSLSQNEVRLLELRSDRRQTGGFIFDNGSQIGKRGHFLAAAAEFSVFRQILEFIQNQNDSPGNQVTRRLARLDFDQFDRGGDVVRAKHQPVGQKISIPHSQMRTMADG